MGKDANMKKRQQKLNYIKNLIKDKKYNRALYEIVNYINTHPDDMLGHYLYGKLLLRKNELQTARREFELVASSHDDNEVKSLMNLATIARKEGNVEEAILYYRKVVEDSCYEDIYAINVLAHVLRHEKRYAEALDILDKTSSLAPELTKERVKNLSMSGRIDEALSILETITPTNRLEEREVSLNKGRIAKAQEEYTKAAFYFEEAKEETEKDEIYYKAVYEEAKLALFFEQYEAVIAYCEELRCVNHLFDGEVYLFLGQANQALAQYQEAYELYCLASETAVDRDIKADAFYYLGSLEFAKGDLLQAETAFKISSTNARKPSLLTYTKLIGVLYRQKQYEEAMNYLNWLNKSNPEFIQHTPLEYFKLLIDKRMGKKLPKRENCTYAERQIIKYSEEEALAHIKSHHQGTGKTRGNFSSFVDIDALYYDVRANLNKDNKVNEDAMDVYEIDCPDVGYNLENKLVHRVRVIVFPHTKNILTMYPGCRATVPRRGEIKNIKTAQKVKK